MSTLDRNVLDIVGGFIYDPKTDLYLLVNDPKRGVKFYTETMELGETTEAAFKRGLLEESGVTIKEGSLEKVLEYTGPGMKGDDLHNTIFYAEVAQIGQPTKPGEAQSLWLNVHDLRLYRTECENDLNKIKENLDGSERKLRLLQYQQMKLFEADYFLNIIENRKILPN